MKPQKSPRPTTTSSPTDTRNADLEQKIALKRAGRLASTPDRWKGHFVAAWSLKAPGQPTCAPRRAIRAFCLECCGFDVPTIAQCASYACPLWNFRPFQKP